MDVSFLRIRRRGTGGERSCGRHSCNRRDAARASHGGGGVMTKDFKITGPGEYYDGLLNACAKQHNVYQCELVDMPK